MPSLSSMIMEEEGVTSFQKGWSSFGIALTIEQSHQFR